MLRDVLKGSHRIGKADYRRRIEQLRDALLAAQAEARQAEKLALAVIVTGVPTAGRSEVVNHLLEWLDPKFVTVHAFGAPAGDERLRPPLWRHWQVLPARGRIALYFSGWYADYISEAVYASRKAARQRHRRALERILQLETMLAADGVRVVKIHLHVDASTQRKRLAELRADKRTRWRVTREESRLVRHHEKVSRAIEHCLTASNHAVAPWHLIDGTDANYRAVRVAEILLQALRADPRAGVRRSPVVVAALAKKVAAVRAVAPCRLSEEEYAQELERLQGRLALLVRRRRFRQHALVLVFEGMDAAGKGGAIRRVTHALDARQYQVVPIAAPTAEERRYPYLWRFWRAVPKRGQIAIFDRSWYGRVLVERVRGFASPPDWRRAYREINEFERQLREHGTLIVKFWLEVSKAEQLERFKARDADPLKRFKVDPEDWVNRRHYGSYQRAVAQMLSETATKHAQWTVIDADDKKQARLAVLRAVCSAVEAGLG